MREIYLGGMHARDPVELTVLRAGWKPTRLLILLDFFLYCLQ